ncbi:hypothetical protein [Dictyobacter halimunensis]|uniref:hypothetical protein n=1 Tax=Dictyobacter halimunensis TaxID=3026934 RepID=UPI0030C742EC
MLLHLTLARCGPPTAIFDNLSLAFAFCGIVAFFTATAFSLRVLQLKQFHRWWVITVMAFFASFTSILMAAVTRVPIFVCGPGFDPPWWHNLYITMHIMCLWKVIETLAFFVVYFKVLSNKVVSLQFDS